MDQPGRHSTDTDPFGCDLPATAQTLTTASVVGNLTSPDQFDIDVGTIDRVNAIHDAAGDTAIVMGEPTDFLAHGIRCFMLIDPNGVAINIVAPLRPLSRDQ